MNHPAGNGSAPALPKAIFLCDKPENVSRVWNAQQLQRLSRWVALPRRALTSADMEAHCEWLAETTVIFSTWGMPRLGPEQLALLPNLRAVFYAAGTVKAFAQPLWERNVLIVSAASANAVPVAEFTLAQILFGLKLGWQHVRHVREYPPVKKWNRLAVPGAYNATVGIISLGMIGSKLCELLGHFALRKIACDPYVGPDRMAELGAIPATLEEVFRESDVVTVHTPWLQETESMITGSLVASMKPGATLINTSRGALVREDELVGVLRERQDLTAFLDVTCPEPPLPHSPLYELPNVVITPHIAGSMGAEVFRMSDLMIEEFRAWQENRPLRHVVSPEQVLMAA